MVFLIFFPVLVNRADYVCTKRFPGGPQKERFLKLDWVFKLEPTEFMSVIAENQELKDEVSSKFDKLTCIYVRVLFCFS